MCVPGLNCYSCPGAAGACPIGAFQAVVGSSKFSFSYYITGILILLGVLLGRFICGFLCPFGWFQELLHKIPTKKLSTKRLKPLTYLKYVILVVMVFLLPVLGMALPGGVQHPATPERQTPPDSTPTQAVQKSARNPPGDSAPSTGSRRPPTAETRTEEEQDSLSTQDRLDLRSASLSPIAPADSTAPTGNDSLLRDSLRQDTTQRDTTRKKILSWTTSSAAKTRTRSTTTYATARSISTTRVISTTRT